MSEWPLALIDHRLDLAARVAWLYHAKGQTQEEIARALNLSRQIVQRLIALAASEHLIRFQLVHPLANCILLADRLKERHELAYCEVVPTVNDPAENVASIAAAAAFFLETLFSQTEPVTVGIGGRRVISQTALRVPPMNRPQHRLFSLMGNLTREGRAGHYDVILGLAERIGAQCYPMPMPVVASTVEEKQLLQAQYCFRASLQFAEQADALLMGIGFVSQNSPLYQDGFITREELDQVIASGAVCEMLGYCFDANGNLVDAEHHNRLTSFWLRSPALGRTVVAQCGADRVPAMRAALVGRLISGLITDEYTAELLLDKDAATKKPHRADSRKRRKPVTATDATGD